jgi:hypothetical protein
VSEGPLKGPDGTSVAADVRTDDNEFALWSGGEADSDGDIRSRWLVVVREGVGETSNRKAS